MSIDEDFFSITISNIDPYESPIPKSQTKAYCLSERCTGSDAAYDMIDKTSVVTRGIDICPECGHYVKWISDDDLNKRFSRY